jgi:hypothetical protein
MVGRFWMHQYLYSTAQETEVYGETANVTQGYSGQYAISNSTQDYPLA